MKTYSNKSFIFAVCLSGFAILVAAGCSSNDNRTPTADEIKVANANRLKYIDGENLSPEAKADLKSRMGGPPYTNPAIKEAMDKAAAKRGALPPGARQF